MTVVGLLVLVILILLAVYLVMKVAGRR